MKLIGSLSSLLPGKGVLPQAYHINFYEEGIIIYRFKLRKDIEVARLKYTDVQNVEYHAPSMLKQGALVIHLRALQDYKDLFTFPVPKGDAKLCEAIRDHINSVISF